MHEAYPQKNEQDSIAHALDRDTASLRLDQLSGGFAGADKYIVRSTEDSSPIAFAKLIANTGPSHEVAVARAEIQNYKLLHELSLTGHLFPEVISPIDDGTYTGLLLPYYEKATWAGPWTSETITALYDAMSTFHSTPLSSEQVEQLLQTKESLEEQGQPTELYDKAQKAFSDDKRTITNSRGEVIFQTPSPALFEALFENEPTPNGSIKKLIARDVNMYNICFDGITPHLVDPVYLDVGDPYQDLLNIGHDVIGQLPKDSSNVELVKKLFVPKDPHSKVFLDSIAYGLMASQKPYDHNTPWMDYQQNSLLVKLDLWHEI